MADLYSTDVSYPDQIYKHAGFSSTVSSSFSSPSNYPSGVAFDGSNAITVDGGQNKIYVHAGFSSTVSSSFTGPGGAWGPADIDFDGTNIYIAQESPEIIYKQSGVSATVDASFSFPKANNYPESISNIDGNPIISCIDTDIIYCHLDFTNIIYNSFSSVSINPIGVARSGADLIGKDNISIIYLFSGISATIQSSFSSPDSQPMGIFFENGEEFPNLYSTDIDTPVIYKHEFFSSTITASFSSPSTAPTGVTFINPDVVTADLAGVIYIHSNFSDTVQSSFSSPSDACNDISFDNWNIYSCDGNSNKIYKHSGKTGTIASSFAAQGNPVSICYVYANLVECCNANDAIYVHDAGFNAQIKSSFSSPAADPFGVARSVNNLVSVDQVEAASGTGTIYLHSGVTATIQSSFSSPSGTPAGINLGLGAFISSSSSSSSSKSSNSSSSCSSSKSSCSSCSSSCNSSSCSSSSNSQSSCCSSSCSSSSCSSSSQASNLYSTDTSSPDQVYKHQGFTDTITDSFSSPCTLPTGIVFADPNVITCDALQGDIYIHSGFSDTVSSSFSSPGYGNPLGMNFDGTNIYTCDGIDTGIYKHSGQTATVTASFSSPSGYPSGITFVNDKFISCDPYTDRIYVHNAFSATVSTSFATIGPAPHDLARNGNDLVSVDQAIGGGTIYLHNGITNTIKSSFSSPDSAPAGIYYDVGEYVSSSSSSSHSVSSSSSRSSSKSSSSQSISSISCSSSSSASVSSSSSSLSESSVSGSVSSSSSSSHSIMGQFIVEEEKIAGGKPCYYVAYGRDIKAFDSDDYTAGVHTNTQFIGDALQLAPGKTVGYWTSEVIDTEFLTPNTIYDRITWTEVLNSGTVTVQLKSAAASGDVPASTPVTYLEGSSNDISVLDHTPKYRYYQIIITLHRGTSSPTVANFKVRYKALIPTDEYVSLGSITCGTDPDFTNITAGGVSITVDNSANQWEKRDADSYIYGYTIHFKKLEIWAGYEYPSGFKAYLIQFLGEIESISVSSGDGGECSCSISARDFLYRKLINTKIGRPLDDGTPAPYMAGIRYRVPCIETDTISHIYSFYSQQDITSINAVYIRDTASNKWEAVTPASSSTINKTVTFASDPGAEVSVDITIDSNIHPCDIITDIITNELELDTDEYSATSITTTESRTTGLEVGVCFNNIPVLDAFRQLGLILDAAIWIEAGVLKVWSYYPSISADFDFDDSTTGHQTVRIEDSASQVQNTAGIFYGNYDEDKTSYVELQVADSVDTYGVLSREDLYFRYADPVSVTSSSKVISLLGQWLTRQNQQFEIITIKLPFSVIRTEIMDVVSLTANKHSLSSFPALLYNKTINVSDLSGTATLIGYSGNDNYLYWSDPGDTEDLYYLVDYPVPEDQEEFMSYFY